MLTMFADQITSSAMSIGQMNSPYSRPWLWPVSRAMTVSQMIEERIQCLAAVSGNGDTPIARARPVRGAGASAVRVAGSSVRSRPALSPMRVGSYEAVTLGRQPDDEIVIRKSSQGQRKVR